MSSAHLFVISVALLLCSSAAADGFTPVHDLIQFEESAWTIEGRAARGSWFAVDTDGDRKAEIVLRDTTEPMVEVLRPDFPTRRFLSLGMEPAPPGILLGKGDLSGDGLDDLFLWDAPQRKIHIGISTGGIHFSWQEPLDGKDLHSPTKVFVAEADEIPGRDLVVSELPVPRVSILKAGSFVSLPRLIPSAAAMNNAEKAPVVFADVNADGKIDTLTPQEDGIRIFVTGLSSRSVLHAALPRELNFMILSPLHLTREPFHDLLVANQSNIFGWWAVLSTPENSIEYPITAPFLTSIDSRSLQAADLDGDGYEDLMAEPLPKDGTIHIAVRRATAESEDKLSRRRYLSARNGPRVCLGFTWHQGEHLAHGGPLNTWLEKFGRVHFDCPTGFAVLDALGTCCPLPASDILEGAAFSSDHACPADSVVTGFEPVPNSVRERALRCRKINSGRYRLSLEQMGTYWGYAFGMRGEYPRIDRSDLPVAFRYGAGRVSYRSWDSHGCVGMPPGSLFVAESGRRCRDRKFRVLQYRGEKGDPPAGTPVKIFPDCIDIEDRYDPATSCLSSTEAILARRKKQ